ncbi:hypothetical protein [Rhodopseudomonas sp. P2A-2r]|uniref:hypothetical protein n=1 Tax=unclassified Rhodopseudomonas TaxID=2638247 RepID=UPI0022345248|nr:hypothetical protein [Rhodopseudomonas sp. P2A-2r]UZE46861.1 hypothetical protein ONR75_17645 [Rhodopseudomonas sp. P2A-2r]
MINAFDTRETVEMPGDVSEAIDAYLDENFGDDVLDFQIYFNDRGEHSVAIAFQTEDVVNGGVLLVMPVPSSGENMYDLTGIYEDEGPVACLCPQRILDLLSPTDSQLAIDWRERCRERLRREVGQAALPAPLPEAMADFSDRLTDKGFPMPKDNGPDDMDDFNRGHDWKSDRRLNDVVEEPSGPRF